MSTYRQIYYHIVYGTKYREAVITQEYDKELYRFIWGIVEANNCKLYQINGIEDHLHLLIDLHPTVSLSNLVKDIKVSSSIWLKRNKKFPLFKGWQVGYGAFTCSERSRNAIIAYIKNQKKHHKREASQDEYKRLLKEHRIDFDDRHLI